MRQNIHSSWKLVGALAFAFLFTLVFFAPTVYGAARLPRVFGDNMVLQRDAKTPVWGWADPGEQVAVEINGASATTTADPQGVWRVDLEPREAGGPHELTVKASNQIVLRNVYYGEVWLCAGQSNMTFPLKRSKDGASEIKTATYPQLRFLVAPQLSVEAPRRDFDASWRACSPESVADVSALAYYFGQYLHEKLQTPVGIIVAAWSGSTCEAWVAPTALEKFPELAPLLDNGPKTRRSPSQKAGALYNGMIAPIHPYAIKGVVWYQGESNTNRAWQYRTLFPILIASWRESWGQGDFPFYYVQLPNFMATKDAPSSSAWAELREAQHKTLSGRNVGEVVTIDLGEANDMHPKDKRTLATRIGNLALAKAYEREIACSGPEFRSIKIIQDKAILTFSATGALKTRETSQCDDSKLRGFALAGADKVFHWADARIEGDTIVLSAPGVTKPAAARYAWADNPVCNLTDDTGLPASPFRTDDWPGVTVDAQ